MKSSDKALEPENNHMDNMRDFNRSLPMSLLRAREAVMTTFIPHLRKEGLSPQQWRVIRSLEQEDGLSISEISKRCHLLKPSMSRIVQNLESRDIIRRENSENDQRGSKLYLADKGLTLFKHIAPKSEERYNQITEKFGYGKLELLYELLDDLVNAVSEEDP